MEEWEYAALTIQRIYRGRRAFFSFLRKMKRRDQAARTLQRVYRGHLGRRRTHKMLLEFYRIKRAQILKEKKECKLEIVSSSYEQATDTLLTTKCNREG